VDKKRIGAAKMKIPNSKRLRFASIAVGVNIGVFLFGIYYGADLTALGTGLSMANMPVYVYILGDSFRPSENK
jgi:hypothetical protein